LGGWCRAIALNLRHRNKQTLNPLYARSQGEMAIAPQAIVSIAEIYLPPDLSRASQREKSRAFRDPDHIGHSQAFV
jgi:hypothetical protein